jgi:hypothetical protein
VDSVTKLQNLKKGEIVLILTETQGYRKLRVEVTERKSSNADMANVLIYNVILAIKLMFSVQNIHDHLAKYTTIPESWRSKNHAFEFAECINSVI